LACQIINIAACGPPEALIIMYAKIRLTMFSGSGLSSETDLIDLMSKYRYVLIAAFREHYVPGHLIVLFCEYGWLIADRSRTQREFSAVFK
jgi:hypothetical protein